jgi:hypothetical protein
MPGAKKAIAGTRDHFSAPSDDPDLAAFATVGLLISITADRFKWTAIRGRLVGCHC